MITDDDPTPIHGDRAYEYESFITSAGDVGETLNDFAAEGWRLATSQAITDGNVLCILERPYVAPLMPEDDDGCGEEEGEK